MGQRPKVCPAQPQNNPGPQAACCQRQIGQGPDLQQKSHLEPAGSGHPENRLSPGGACACFPGFYGLRPYGRTFLKKGAPKTFIPRFRALRLLPSLGIPNSLSAICCLGCNPSGQLSPVRFRRRRALSSYTGAAFSRRPKVRLAWGATP